MWLCFSWCSILIYILFSFSFSYPNKEEGFGNETELSWRNQKFYWQLWPHLHLLSTSHQNEQTQRHAFRMGTEQVCIFNYFSIYNDLGKEAKDYVWQPFFFFLRWCAFAKKFWIYVNWRNVRFIEGKIRCISCFFFCHCLSRVKCFVIQDLHSKCSNRLLCVMLMKLWLKYILEYIHSLL